jgi:hypothetical protein
MNRIRTIYIGAIALSAMLALPAALAAQGADAVSNRSQAAVSSSAGNAALNGNDSVNRSSVNKTDEAGNTHGPNPGDLANPVAWATPIRSNASGTAGLSCGRVLPSALPAPICDMLARCCARSPGGQCCVAFNRNCGGGQ